MGEDDAKLEKLADLYMRAEEKLSFLASIVDSSNDAIIGLTQDGIILSWNSGAQRIYGYSADEIIGCSILILAPPDRQNEIPWLLNKIRQANRIENFETVRVRKDGKQINVSLTLSPVKDMTDRIIGIISTCKVECNKSLCVA